MDIADIGGRLSTKAKTISRNRGIESDRFLSLLAREQLLAAVGRVAPEDTVALKGSALVLLDDRIAEWVRPSSDLDLHMHGADVADLRDLLDRAAAEVASVGIRIEWGRRKPLWQPDGTEGGEKVRVVAYIGKTRVNFELDAWVGGDRTPGMRVIETASMLPGLPAVRRLAYPLEAMVADKLHAIVQFGAANNRRKDFYDLWHLAGRDFDPALLSACVETTFGNNKRAVPTTPVLLPGFGRTYAAANQAEWTRMLADAGRQDRAPADFVEVVDRVRALANRAFAPAPSTQESRRPGDSFKAECAPRAMAFA